MVKIGFIAIGLFIAFLLLSSAITSIILPDNMFIASGITFGSSIVITPFVLRLILNRTKRKNSEIHKK